jgi:cell division protease FtsH
MARAIVVRYGMNERLGLVAYETERHPFLNGLPEPPGTRTYSELTAREIDCEVRELVHAAYETATRVLVRARRVLEHGAQALLEKESLGERELVALRTELGALTASPGTVPAPMADLSATAA